MKKKNMNENYLKLFPPWTKSALYLLVALFSVFGIFYITNYFFFHFDPDDQAKTTIEKHHFTTDGDLSNNDADILANCVQPYSGMDTSKSLTLCRGDYFLPVGDNEAAITIVDDDITFDCNGASIRGDNSCKQNAWGDEEEKGWGIFLKNRKGIKVVNCTIKNYCIGINIDNSQKVHVENNILGYNHFSSDFGDQIQILNGKYVFIKNNTFYGGKNEGIYINGGSNLMISNNSLINTNKGIKCDSLGCFSVDIIDNVILNTGQAIEIQNSQRVSVRGNILKNNTVGINLETKSENCLVVNNHIEGSGFFGFGISMRKSTHHNKIYNNHIAARRTCLDNGEDNSWHTFLNCTMENILGGPCVGGNYYSDYAGNDSDGNGIGDVSYQIEGSADRSDNLPLVFLDK